MIPHGDTSNGAMMDILSLTRTAPRTQDIQPRATSSSPAPSAKVEAADKAPPNSAATGQRPTMEAARNGQKTPETMLDHLEKLFAGNVGLDASSKELMATLEFPPKPDAVLAVLTSLGVPVPTSQDMSVGKLVSTLVNGLQATNLPQPVKSVIGEALVSTTVEPLPASDLIGMGRENTPAPPTQWPTAFAATEPGPSDDSAPVPASTSPGQPLPASQGFVSDSAPVPNSGQDLDLPVVQSLNLTAISNGDAEEAPVPTAPTLGKPVRFAPLPTQDGQPRPTVTVPKPTLEGGGNGPQVVSIGRQVAENATRTVPLPNADNGVTTVPRPNAQGVQDIPRPTIGPRPMPVPLPGRDRTADPVEGAPVATTVKLDPAAPTGTAQPVATLPVASETDTTGKSGAVEPSPAVGLIKPTLGPDPAMDLLDELTGEEAPEPAAGRGVADPKPVVGRPEATTVATLKPVADPLPASTSEKLVDQLASRMETMALSKRPSRVTMHLEPRDLGTITVSVKSLGHKVDASVQTSHDDVRASLEANRQALVQNVESRGLTLNSFDIGQNPGENGRGQTDQASQAEMARNAQLRQAATTTPRPVAPAGPLYKSSTAAVDYLV